MAREVNTSLSQAPAEPTTHKYFDALPALAPAGELADEYLQMPDPLCLQLWVREALAVAPSPRRFLCQKRSMLVVDCARCWQRGKDDRLFATTRHIPLTSRRCDSGQRVLDKFRVVPALPR